MRSLLLAGLAATLAALPLAGQAADPPTQFQATLSGSQETPPVATNTVGSFRIAFSTNFATAFFDLDVISGVRITQAHLHCAPVGHAGPIVVFLAGFHANGWEVDGNWVSDTALSNANVLTANTPGANCPADINNLRDLAAAAAAGLIYVNVHNQAFPSGVVRGQLVRSGRPLGR